MAEGLLRHMAGDRIEVASAGTQPVGLNPRAVEVMREVGIDISRHRSKKVSEWLGQRFTYVITVCDSARQSCPVFPGAFKSFHWSIEDPAGATGTDEERTAVFRRIRNELDQRIRGFLEQSADSL
jgi:arsenate reductase